MKSYKNKGLMLFKFGGALTILVLAIVGLVMFLNPGISKKANGPARFYFGTQAAAATPTPTPTPTPIDFSNGNVPLSIGGASMGKFATIEQPVDFGYTGLPEYNNYGVVVGGTILGGQVATIVHLPADFTCVEVTARCDTATTGTSPGFTISDSSGTQWFAGNLATKNRRFSDLTTGTLTNLTFKKYGSADVLNVKTSQTLINGSFTLRASGWLMNPSHPQ